MPVRQTGRYERSTIAGEAINAFVPFPLPPNVPLALDGDARVALLEAEQALARLDLAGDMVPSLDWFIYAFVRKEAVLSSQIEGTQATLIDLLAYEARAAAGGEGRAGPTADVEEVTNYLSALEYARGELTDASGLPLSVRTCQKLGVRGVRSRRVNACAGRRAIVQRFRCRGHAAGSSNELP